MNIYAIFFRIFILSLYSFVPIHTTIPVSVRIVFSTAFIRPASATTGTNVSIASVLNPRSSFLLLDGVLSFVIRTLNIHEEILLVFLLLLSHNAVVFVVDREIWTTLRCGLLR